MAMLSEKIILSWWLLYSHRFTICPFDMSPNIMTTEQKVIGYQGIRATQAFEHENTRIHFKYCYF